MSLKIFDKHIFVDDTFASYIDRNIKKLTKRINSRSLIEFASFYYNKHGVGSLDIFVNEISDIKDFLIGESILSEKFQHRYFGKDLSIEADMLEMWETKIADIKGNRRFNEKKDVLICLVKKHKDYIENLYVIACPVDKKAFLSTGTIDKNCLEYKRLQDDLEIRETLEEVDNMIDS